MTTMTRLWQALSTIRDRPGMTAAAISKPGPGGPEKNLAEILGCTQDTARDILHQPLYALTTDHIDALRLHAESD